MPSLIQMTAIPSRSVLSKFANPKLQIFRKTSVLLSLLLLNNPRQWLLMGYAKKKFYPNQPILYAEKNLLEKLTTPWKPCAVKKGIFQEQEIVKNKIPLTRLINSHSTIVDTRACKIQLTNLTIISWPRPTSWKKRRKEPMSLREGYVPALFKVEIAESTHQYTTIFQSIG